MLVTLIPAFLPAPSPRDTLRLWNGGPAARARFFILPANFDFLNFFLGFFLPKALQCTAAHRREWGGASARATPARLVVAQVGRAVLVRSAPGR